MSQSTLNYTEVNEDATPTYTAQIQDNTGNNLAKTSISTATVRVINVSDGTIVQADTSILTSIGASGALSLAIPAAYINATSGASRSVYARELIFTITQTGGLVDVHHLVLNVRRSVS